MIRSMRLVVSELLVGVQCMHKPDLTTGVAQDEGEEDDPRGEQLGYLERPHGYIGTASLEQTEEEGMQSCEIF